MELLYLYVNAISNTNITSWKTLGLFTFILVLATVLKRLVTILIVRYRETYEKASQLQTPPAAAEAGRK